MYNETYDEYIRSILGYPAVENYQNNRNQYSNNVNLENSELEKCYPEIYKIVYPMVSKRCSNSSSNITDEELERMTDEIYFALENQNETQININLTNNVRSNTNTYTKQSDKRADTKIKETTNEKRETRQFNRGLRDLIKILLIRELLNRPGRPPIGPRPPFPPPGHRPPVRPPFGPGPGRPPFMREFEPNSGFDIFENWLSPLKML